jgi:N-carbamoyl-L-amino-acid hydrolase
MLASGVISGQFDSQWVYDREDMDGIRYEDELIRIGYKGDKENRLSGIKSYLEPHIEQGPVLDAAGKNMGIVTGALGITGLDVTIKGEANHAGTTPMSHRKDALCAAADVILKIRGNCIAFGEPAVITNGIIHALPASKNIVPGEVYFSVDLRYHTDDGMAELERQTIEIIRKTCEEHGVEVEIERYWRAKPAKFNDMIVDCVAEAAKENDMDAVKIISGAGHDAVFINDVFPTGMIFVPSIKGMSHCPQENTKWEDVVKGTEVTADVILKLDKVEIE